MHMPALIIFDCDGVLVDSERISHIVLQQMLAERGVRLSYDEAVARFMGTSMQRCMELVEQMVQVPAAAFLPEFRSRSYAAFAAQLEPVEGVEELLASLTTPYCVASNGPREKMLLTLGQTRLLGRFADRMFSADDVARPKPAPDLFLHAARCLSAPPEACVVIEDSPSGVRAARAAGMSVLGYAAMTPAHNLLEAGADDVFDAMASLPSLLGLGDAPRQLPRRG